MSAKIIHTSQALDLDVEVRKIESEESETYTPLVSYLIQFSNGIEFLIYSPDGYSTRTENLTRNDAKLSSDQMVEAMNIVLHFLARVCIRIDCGDLQNEGILEGRANARVGSILRGTSH